jgi:hypothetical protein
MNQENTMKKLTGVIEAFVTVTVTAYFAMATLAIAFPAVLA